MIGRLLDYLVLVAAFLTSWLFMEWRIGGLLRRIDKIIEFFDKLKEGLE